MKILSRIFLSLFICSTVFAGNARNVSESSQRFFYEQSSKPTVSTNLGAAYTKDVSGTTEYFFENDAGTEVQLTSGGAVYGGFTSLATLTSGTAITAGSYQIGRDADATNQIHFNVPTGSTFEFSINDVAEMTLSGTAVNFQNNTITTTGGGSLTGTWTDMGAVTTIDINGGTVDGTTIGGASAAAGTFTTVTTSTSGNSFTATNTSNAASSQVAILQGDRASPADLDAAYLSLQLSNDAGTQKEFARLTWIAADVNQGTSEDGQMQISLMSAASVQSFFTLSTTAFRPTSNDGSQLGATTTSWSDLFLASGGIINWNNGDVTITHNSDTLAFAGGASGYTFDTKVAADGFCVTNATALTGATNLTKANMQAASFWPIDVSGGVVDIDIEESLDADDVGRKLIFAITVGHVTNALTITSGDSGADDPVVVTINASGTTAEDVGDYIECTIITTSRATCLVVATD